MSGIRRKRSAAPVYLLEATAAPGRRTQVTGALWDGVLNATPDDDTDGPSPVEALMAALAACVIRNLRSVTDAAHVTFEAVAIRIAAERSDEPPALTAVRLEIAAETRVPTEQATRLVALALRDGTITRTLARATDLDVRLTINGLPVAVSYAR